MNGSGLIALMLQFKPLINAFFSAKNCQFDNNASNLIIFHDVFFHARYLETITRVFDIDLPNLIPLGGLSCAAHDLGLVGLVCYVQLAKWVHLAEEFCAARELCFDYMELELS